MQLVSAPRAAGALAGARAEFARARRRARAARARRRLLAHQPGATRPRDPGSVAALPLGPARLRPVPLDAIVGTVDAATDFDADFRPATERVSARWQSV